VLVEDIASAEGAEVAIEAPLRKKLKLKLKLKLRKKPLTTWGFGGAS